MAGHPGPELAIGGGDAKESATRNGGEAALAAGAAKAYVRLSSLEAYVLNFLLEREPEALYYARLQVRDDGAQLLRRPTAGVINQVGVIVRDVDAAIPYAFGAHLFEEVRRGNLALANHPLRHLLAGR